MTANEVDAALAAAPDDVGPALLALVEDQWFERKSARIAPRDLAVPLSAMANADGGMVVVGLSAGVVEGTKANAGRVNDLRQASIDHISPPVRTKISTITCRNVRGELDTLLLFEVQPSEIVHELANGDCYLRVGDESRRLTFQQRQELLFDKGQGQYDGHIAEGATQDDLDDELIDNFRQRAGGTRSGREILVARGLIRPTREVTNAGILLFGKHPQERFPQAYIRVLRFLTVARGTGASLGLDDDSDIAIEGSIPWSIQRASAVIDGFVPRRRSLTPEGTFEGKPIVPRDAWLEGVVNAVVHRSYSLSGDHIRVEIYPNRIEIESPGRFPGLADPRNPLEISRFARNPRIARVCADLRIGQELGEGIKRMFDEMRRAGLSDPAYMQSSGSVRLTLAAVPSIPPHVAARLPQGSQRLLNILRSSDTPLGTGDIAEAMELSRPATKTRLKALEQEGYIRWSGKSSNDPRAVWVLVDR